MRAYLVGFTASLGLLVAASGASYLVSPARSPGEILWLVVLLLVLPTCAAWVAVQTIDVIRPRRLFDPRVERPELALMLGAVGGALCVACLTLWRAFFEHTLSDGVLVSLMAVLGVALTAGLSPRVRLGRCVYCATRLERLDLCHECGTPA